MKITSAQFIKSAVWPPQYPPAIMPEIAFVGRSNVGKSSLMNTIVGRKNLAKDQKHARTDAVNQFFYHQRKNIFCGFAGYGLPKFPGP
jgi:GTP-binding protein